MRRRLREERGYRVKEEKERQGYSNTDRMRDRDYSREVQRERAKKERQPILTKREKEMNKDRQKEKWKFVSHKEIWRQREIERQEREHY